MANKKTKLELTWIGKENRPKLEPRILIEDSENDSFDNRLTLGFPLRSCPISQPDNQKKPKRF